MTFIQYFRFFLVTVLAVLVSGCLSDGSTSNGSVGNAVNGINANLNINGVLMKGPVSGADINVYVANSDGSKGGKIASFKTSASGEWSGTLPFGSQGVLLVESSAGAYTDEVSNTQVAIGTNNGFMGVLDLNASQQVALTPWSHAVYLAAKAGIVSTFENAVRDAAQDATVSLGFNPLSTLLKDPSGNQAGATSDEKRYAALTAAFAQMYSDYATQLTNLNNANPFDVMLAFARDISDGKLDAKDVEGNAITVSSNLPGSTLVALSQNGTLIPLENAATNYINATATLSGVSVSALQFSIAITN